MDTEWLLHHKIVNNIKSHLYLRQARTRLISEGGLNGVIPQWSDYPV